VEWSGEAGEDLKAVRSAAAAPAAAAIRWVGDRREVGKEDSQGI
jgi:hypothetical protein